MILSLCLLLLALNPSSQEICSAPGALQAPTLYLTQLPTWLGNSVLLLCSVFFGGPVSRVVFCKDGEEISSQMGLLGKHTYDYVYAVSRGSSGNYFCGYEIKDSDNQVISSQLSSAQQFIMTAKGGEQQRRTMSPAVWITRYALALLLLMSAPIITFVLEKWGLPSLWGWGRLVELWRGAATSQGKEELRVGEPH